MKKIALIAPGKDIRYSATEPLNLAYIAGYLEKNGINVKIIDELAGQNVKKSLEKYNPDIVGITGTTPVINEAYELAEYCRNKGILTVIGGVHANIMPEEALQHCDIVVKGEGEKAFLKIINEGIIKGIIECDFIKDISELSPARHLLDMEFYANSRDRMQESFLNYIPLHTRVASVITSRGCPYRCTFCHNSWRGIPVRYSSPEKVVEELKLLIKDYKIGAVFFIDDDLFAERERINKICNLMIKEGLSSLIWGANSRVNHVDPEVLGLAKKAGCKQITFGFESGSQKVLNSIKKGTTVEQSAKAIKLVKEAGLIVNGTFIIGNPGETVEDVKMTQKFIKENDIDYYGVCITTPYPGTEIWKWCSEHGMIPADLDYSKFNFTEIPPVCAADMISKEELIKLFYETINIKAPSSSISLGAFLKSVIKDPGDMLMKAMKNPRRILNVLKRMRV